MVGLTSTIENYFKSLFLNSLYLPASLSYVVLIGLVFLSVALIFKGSTTWKLLFVVLGAYYGYIFASFLLHYIPLSSTPATTIVTLL